MILDNDVGNPELALYLARLIAQFDAPSPAEALRSVLTSTLPGPIGVTAYPASNAYPAFAVCSSGNDRVLLVAGCSLPAHAAQTLAGYAGTVSDTRSDPTNAYFVSIADTILSTAGPTGLLTGNRLTMAGHSLGGAVVSLMLTYGQLQSKAFSLRAVSFGAPKLGGVSLASQLSTAPLRRWMNTDDPVPLFPPTTADTLAVMLTNPPWAVQRFSNFVQPGGGLEITADFRFIPAALPSAASINVISSLAAWLLAIDGSSQSGHHILSYIGRLQTWVASVQSPQAVVLRGGPPEPPERTDRKELTAAEVNVKDQLSALAAQQTSRGVALPDSVRVRAVRQGIAFAVVFGDVTIAVTPFQKSARTMARNLQLFLKQMQPLALVDTTALLQRFASYLEEASDPDGGFTPVMNTRLPG